jgi:hypothetical protein
MPDLARLKKALRLLPCLPSWSLLFPHAQLITLLFPKPLLPLFRTPEIC